MWVSIPPRTFSLLEFEKALSTEAVRRVDSPFANVWPRGLPFGAKGRAPSSGPLPHPRNFAAHRSSHQRRKFGWPIKLDFRIRSMPVQRKSMSPPELARASSQWHGS
jgi:hypothetical protein